MNNMPISANATNAYLVWFYHFYHLDFIFSNGIHSKHYILPIISLYMFSVSVLCMWCVCV